MATNAYLMSKIGPVSASTRAKTAEILNAARAAGVRIRFVWGKGAGKEHGTGNAVDIMVYNAAGGNWVRNYVWANRARLRLRHVIWNQAITSTVSNPGQRRGMPNRGNPTANHKDHNHIFFLDSRKYVPRSGTPTKTTTPTKPPAKGKLPLATVAAQVIAGKWGNGPARTKRLTAAGYNARAVQAEVNRRMRR